MPDTEIDAVLLGKLEVGWWIAHNEHDIPKLKQLLIEQNMALCGIGMPQF